MRDRAIVGSMIPETDESEYAAVIDILSNADNAFLDECSSSRSPLPKHSPR